MFCNIIAAARAQGQYDIQEVIRIAADLSKLAGKSPWMSHVQQWKVLGEASLHVAKSDDETPNEERGTVSESLASVS